MFYYVVFDGFDLGVGILYGFAPDASRATSMMNSIAPVWDGNETWLVFGGLGLLAAFPLAFAIIIPAVYFPVLIMLLALVFRGVAFEFRFKHRPHRAVSGTAAFCYGSLVATFAQGIVLGASSRASRSTAATSPATLDSTLHAVLLLTGVCLVFGYALARRRLAGA